MSIGNPLFIMKKIIERHNMNAPKALLYEIFIRLYQRRLFRSLLRPLFKESLPINVHFVVGCYNSGTTVIKQAIALHPEFSCAPVEGDLLTSAMDRHEQGGWPRCMVANSFNIVAERKSSFFDSGQFISDLRPWIDNKKNFLEKSISNSFRVPILRKNFPNARFVCVTRHADTVVSGIQNRSNPTGMARLLLNNGEYPVRLLLRQWLFFYSFLLKDYRSNPSDTYVCSYEKFILDPYKELIQIYNFLNLDSSGLRFKSNVLSYGSRKLEVKAASKKINTSDFIENSEQLEKEIKLINGVLSRGER